MTMATENLPDDIDTLKQIIADLARDAVVAQTEIALKFQLARYQRAEFGRSSEKLAPLAPSHCLPDLGQLVLANSPSPTRPAAQPTCPHRALTRMIWRMWDFTAGGH